MERRLAAILIADVVGYSRIMGEDEAGAFNALKALRKELFAPKVAEHHGRIVKLMGDGALVEFASVVDAVNCAVAVQRALILRNAETPTETPIQLRIGVNLGDVIIEGSDIYGDGVNVAARLQVLAEPGGITLSATAHEHAAAKVDFSFKPGGEHEFKNIATPVRVYHWVDEDAGRRPDTAPLPDKRSIVVLPFTNMSGDPEQEFFADGLTEDVTTELSRFRDLVVISRNSAFVYKGKAINVQDVARDLGVRYVVEGSVRKAGKRVRVTVQLIEATSDSHIWAERYDRDLEDIFEVQDEITSTIAAILPGRIEAANQERAKRKLPENMAAYEYVLAGKLLHHRSNRIDNEEAQRLLDRAIELDPNYAHAHSWKACVLGQTWIHGWCEDEEATWDQVSAELQIALGLDDNDSDVHRVLAAVNVTRDDLDKAMYHQERALTLNPNDDLIVVQKGEVLTWLGQPEEGIEWIRKAMRLNPYHPERFWSHLGRAYFVAHLYSEAVEAFKRIAEPDSVQHALLAACYAQANDADRASYHAKQVMKHDPDFSVATDVEKLHYKRESDLEHHRESLLKAGLPP
ncbi:MAG: adenylate/guanylate cyclase domain-containing protein [Proteobacteria bacterium]|nr:adenylate/guanylate cyclase domain-containing protein [Pseudomonadota bacterium]